jgi:hypothetical protein
MVKTAVKKVEKTKVSSSSSKKNSSSSSGKKNTTTSTKKRKEKVQKPTAVRLFATSRLRRIGDRRAGIQTNDKGVALLFDWYLKEISRQITGQSCMNTGAQKRIQVTSDDVHLGASRVKGVEKIAL